MKNNEEIKHQHTKVFKKTFFIFWILAVFVILFFISNILVEAMSISVPFFSNEVISALFSALIEILLTYFFSMLKFVPKIKFKLYNFLCRKFHIGKNTYINKIIEKIICLFYYGDYSDIPVQLDISRNLLSILQDESINKSNNRIYYISGESHSGKTISIKRFINNIFTDKTKFDIFKKYNKNIYYYDMEIFANCISEIIDYLRNNEFVAKILIFDNLHKLDKISINRFIKAIFENSSNSDLIVILTRNIEHVLDNTNLNYIKNNKNKSILKSNEVVNNISTQDAIDYFADIIPNFRKINFDEFAKIHLFNIYKSFEKLRTQETILMFNALLGIEVNNPIYRSWAYICCSCCFTGYFSKLNYIKWCGKENRIDYLSFLNGFKKSELINNFADINKNYYNLHEKVARFYVVYICHSDRGKHLCKSIFKYLFDLENSSYLKYIYSIALREKSTENFFDICNNVNYEVMLDDMNYMIKLFNKAQSNYAFELGILNDRVGHFILTEEKIKDIYKLTKDNRCLIFLLHANHWTYFDPEYHNLYENMKKSDNNYIKFATNYWIKHLYMHKGNWNLDNFVNLSVEIDKSLPSITEQSYEGLHFLRRYYFDCFRIYYLQGTCNLDKLNKMLQKLSNIRTHLEKNLEEFDYYNNKFFYGHLIHYDILFKKYVLKESVSDQLSFLNIDRSNNLSVIAYEYYQKAEYMMRVKNDKTADYVYLRMVELSPVSYLNYVNKSDKIDDICNINEEDYEKVIKFYDDFGKNKGINENVYEYAAFAETYKIKFTLICNFLCTTLNIDYLNKAAVFINKARKYHQKYNGNKPNIYGETRISFYESIVHYLLSKNKNAFICKLNELLKICELNNFCRECSMINKLILTQNIRSEYIKDICLYYPIVLQ